MAIDVVEKKRLYMGVDWLGYLDKNPRGDIQTSVFRNCKDPNQGQSSASSLPNPSAP